MVTALVVALAVAVALLGVLVVGLLRSHAEILRRLHELGADVFGDGSTGTRPSGRASAARARAALAEQAPSAGDVPGTPLPPAQTAPGVPMPREGELPAAADLVGITPAGNTKVVGVTGTDHVTLLAFLSSGCETCGGFWDAFAAGEADDLPGHDTRLVVVTRGADSESPAAIARVAPANIATLLSSEAWDHYGVPVSPYFVLVDGPSARVIGEGAAVSWSQVRSLLERAVADAGPRLERRDAPSRGGRRSFTDRQRDTDAELLRAGLHPDHPSLHQVPHEPSGDRPA